MCLTLTFLYRKFGKHLQKRQLDIPEYAASFVNYKALKKVFFPRQADRKPLADTMTAHQAAERDSHASGTECHQSGRRVA